MPGGRVGGNAKIFRSWWFQINLVSGRVTWGGGRGLFYHIPENHATIAIHCLTVFLLTWGWRKRSESLVALIISRIDDKNEKNLKN